MHKPKQSSIVQPLKTGGTDSILAALFRDMVINLAITNTRLDDLMERFLRDKRNAIPQNNKDRASARGNLKKELFKPVMTWKVFCKAIRFLGITRFDVTITLHHPKGVKTVHNKSVNLGDPQFNDDDTDT